MARQIGRISKPEKGSQRSVIGDLSERERRLILVLGDTGCTSEISDKIFYMKLCYGAGREKRAYALTRGAKGMGYKEITKRLKMGCSPVCTLVMGLEDRTHHVLRLSYFNSELFRNNHRSKAVVLTERGTQAYNVLKGTDFRSFDPVI